MNNFCPSCGSKATEDSQFCMNCGYNLNQNVKAQDEKQSIQTDMSQSYNNQYNSVSQPNNGYSNGMGIAGFVISLVSWVCCCGSLSWLSLIFSIIGIKNAKKNNGVGHGLSMAGLIISIIGLVIILLYLLLFGAAFVTEMAFLA